MTSGENYFDLSDWTTGIGGSWENWYVTNGSFNTSSSINPNCSSLAIAEFEFENIKLFPNPFQDEITCTKNTQNTKIECFNVLGKKVILDFSGETINTKNLTSGVYFFKVSTEKASKLIKMIKE
ncbi:T9SS type A sorting domain-containing protein [Lacinutrix jangbogonensis]|uniref:T9SS type A sorting domain-containing protein n=1 Tax=Lacinutrix jangbogonensis TaxID=1469557 RepID=UPI00068D3014|nr:T9SS type A sorting domain-containing protein [Lacinutrix jangbogonensis]